MNLGHYTFWDRHQKASLGGGGGGGVNPHVVVVFIDFKKDESYE